MNYLKLKQKIYEAIERNPLDRSAYEEMFAVCREYEKIDFQTAHAWNHELRNHISWGLRMTVSCQKFDEAREFDDLMFRSLLFGAQHFFDDYLQAVEYGKPLDKKFYQPRRHYLRRYVDAYQEILDGKLDFLSISMPKRAGKSQLGINFTNMLSGKYPDRATLMEGTGDDLVKSFYLGCLEYLTLPSDYHFYDIFPESKLVQTNADTKIINLLHKSRFPTVMCRSIDARQVGLSEATNLLYLDDCVEGREEAKNRQRLDDKWEVISGDIIGRAIEGTPIVICGTRYSLYDPILGNEGLKFPANYDHTAYKALKKLEGKTDGYAVWFGGTDNEDGTVTPTGTDGKFSFDGQLSVHVTGGKVNEVVGMSITIAPSTVIKEE